MTEAAAQQNDGDNKSTKQHVNGEAKDEGEKFTAKDFKELKAKYDTLETKHQRLEEDFAYAKRDKEKLGKAKEERDELVKKGADKGDKDSIERREQLVRDEFQGKLDERDKAIKDKDTEIAKLKGSVEKLLVVDRAMAEIGAMFNEDMHDFVKGKIKEVVAWEGEHDSGQLIVKNENGEARFGNASNQKMTIKEFGEELRSKFPSAAKPTYKGAGMDDKTKASGENKSVVKPPAGFDNWSADKRTQWMTQNPESAKAYMKAQGYAV